MPVNEQQNSLKFKDSQSAIDLENDNIDNENQKDDEETDNSDPQIVIEDSVVPDDEETLPSPSAEVIPASGTTILATLHNFENSNLGIYSSGHIWYNGWGPNGSHWRDFSTYDVVEDGDNKVLRLWVNDDIQNSTAHFNAPACSANLNSVLRAFSILNYLPPEADALRVKIKIENGSIGLTFGMPVSQVGNSDVLTDVKYISTTNNDDCVPLLDGWIQCEFDFNENLIRNSRRGNFTLDTNGRPIKNSLGKEIVHLTRWVQEPMGLYVVPYNSNDIKILNGNPVVLFDDIQIVNKGKGKPFVSNYENSNLIGPVHDFELSINNVYTVDFGFPTHQVSPTLSHVNESNPDKSESKSLKIVSRTFEETAWTAIDAFNGNGANAVTFDIKIDYAVNDNEDHIIDFIALATPSGDQFPWVDDRFFPPISLQHTEDPAYHYKVARSNTTHLDYSIFHARRIIPRRQWKTVTIPFADFAAVYGSGTMANYHLEQKLLKGSEISVIGLQATWVNIRANTEITIDNIRYIYIPDKTNAQLRSFWQGQAEE